MDAFATTDNNRLHAGVMSSIPTRLQSCINVEDGHIEYPVIKEHALEKFINKCVFTKLYRYLYRKVNKLYDKLIFSSLPNSV
jgi:hypothetical protein